MLIMNDNEKKSEQKSKKSQKAHPNVDRTDGNLQDEK